MGHNQKRETSTGLLSGAGAYLIWGFFPLFFRTLATVKPLEIFAHRIIWANLSLLLLVWWMKGFGPIIAALKSRKNLTTLILSTIFIAINWFVFIYAVDVGRVLECSLGYYITPLTNVLFGRFLLKEKLRPLQWTAIALAAAGVMVKAWTIGTLPMISLVLGGSFGAYGLARKLIKVDAITALAVETTIAMPLATAYALYLWATAKGSFLGGSLKIDLLLVCAGIITAIPLLLYGGAITRLKLSTVGVMQYSVPTMQFLIAVFLFGEPFTTGHGITFALIWTGLLLYTWDMTRSGQKGPEPTLEA